MRMPLGAARWDRRLALWNDRLLRFLTPQGLLSLPPIWRYGMAVVIVMAATVLRRALIPWMGTTAPYNIAFLAAVLTTVMLGIGPGLLSVLLGDVTVEAFVLGSLPTMSEGTAVMRMSTSVAIGVFLCWILHAIRAAQIKSRQSEARLNHAEQIADIGNWEWDIETGGVQWSEQVYRQMGEQPGRFTPSHDAFQQSIHPDDHAAFATAVERALAGASPYDMEFRIVRPDGAERVLHSRGEVVPGPDGRPRHMVGVCVNITERKQAEEVLRESERRERERAVELAALLDAAPTPVFIAHDPNCLHITGNPAADALLRSPPGAEASLGAAAEIKPRHFKAVKDGRELRVDELPAQRAARGEPVKDFEFSLVFEDGTVRQVVGNGTPLRDAQGQPRGSVLVLTDITERKRAEESVQAHRQLLEMIVNHIPAAVNLIRGSDLRLQLVNPAYQAIAPGKDMVGKTLDELWPKTGHDFSAMCRRVLETGEPYHVKDDLNMIQRRPDGPLEPAHFSWSLHRVPLPGDQGWGLLNAAWETTERKQAEATLRESEERLRLLGDNLPDSAVYQYVHAPDGSVRFLYFSAGIERLNGVTVQDVLRDASTLHRQSPPEYIEQLVEAEARSERDLSDFDMEMPMRRPDGELRWMRLHSRPRRLPDGRTVWDGVQIDITERKQAEEQLRQSAAELQAANVSLQESRGAALNLMEDALAARQRAEQASADLRQEIAERKRAEEALKEADRRKDEFLAMLAHELRNPLAPIRNAVYLLRLIGPAEPRLEQARDLIDRQVTHMVRLIDDLLDVSRITRGKVTLRKERVDLAAVVAQAVEVARPLTTRKRQAFAMSCPPEPIEVEADPARLVQVLSNLLNNAAKFTEPGGSITLSTERSSDDAVIRVRDTGVGIAPELLPRIFDLFVQGEMSLDRTEGGLGIGLTLVRHVVEQHGGRIEAHSAGRGCGSEFVVTWPAAPAAKSITAPAPAVESAAPVPRLRILVVEDNLDAAESFVMLLQLRGHEIRQAHTGRAALEAAASFVPDVAFIDLGLPGLDGYEVARRLRAISSFQATVLVALTGYGQEEYKQRAKAAGFDHYLTKPVDPSAIDHLLIDVGGPSERASNVRP